MFVYLRYSRNPETESKTITRLGRLWAEVFTSGLASHTVMQSCQRIVPVLNSQIRGQFSYKRLVEIKTT